MINKLKQLRKDAELAALAHNEALQKLRRPNGDPIYSDSVMREQAQAARQVMTKKLDAIAADVKAIVNEAGAVLEAGEADKYKWLDDDELRRAALLLPFVTQDIEALGNDGLRHLEYRTRGGGGQLDRVQAWLYMREAERRNIPSDAFTRQALPVELADALAATDDARRLLSDIEQTRPEFRERAIRGVRGKEFYDATGEPVGA